MGCFYSKPKTTLINVTIPSNQVIKEDNASSGEYSVSKLIEEVCNKRSFPELVGKNKDYVLTYFQTNLPHLIIKFNDELSNPYLTQEIYEFYDILINIKDEIVIEIPSY